MRYGADSGDLAGMPVPPEWGLKFFIGRKTIQSLTCEGKEVTGFLNSINPINSTFKINGKEYSVEDFNQNIDIEGEGGELYLRVIYKTK